MFFLLDGMVHLIHAKKKGNGKTTSRGKKKVMSSVRRGNGVMIGVNANLTTDNEARATKW